MPGWHEATKHLQAQGKVQMVGIIQEQHPNRARLFMQWKLMKWPVLVDAFNLLGLPIVPYTVILDEHGIVRLTRPTIDMLPTIEREILACDFDKPAGFPERKPMVPDVERRQKGETHISVAEWRDYGVNLATWLGPDRLREAAWALDKAQSIEPEHAATHFYLGVIYHRRYDSDYRQSGDFQRAVDQWNRALEINPNNYIWRRWAAFWAWPLRGSKAAPFPDASMATVLD